MEAKSPDPKKGKRHSFRSDKELWFEDPGLKRKKSAMLLPINEINENVSDSGNDQLKDEEIKENIKQEKNTVTVIITGSRGTGKNLLFSRLISKYYSIPFNAIRKEGKFEEGTDKASE